MKKQALIISLLALTAMPASAAINCAVLPTCEELGYNNKTADCDSSNVLKCPFDQTKGKCLGNSAVVGQIGYFYKNPGDGWLVCDGSFYSKEQYPELFSAISTNFGGSGNLFRVPNYGDDGVFLKPSPYSSSSMSKGCVPNIKASGFMAENHDYIKSSYNFFSGALYVSSTAEQHYGSNGGLDKDNPLLKFDASKYNSIYSDYCDAPRPNYYTIGTYIYAGKPVASASSAGVLAKSCAKGNYFYADGTCSSSYNSSKTLKGIVTKAYHSSYSTPYTSVEYIYGGVSGKGTNTYANAEYYCTNAGDSLASKTYSDTSYLPTSISSNSVVAPRAASKYYWFSGYTTKQYCTSASSCSSSSTTNNSDGSYGGPTYPYYYCRGSAYLR